jgi:hypothetical protein
MDLVLADDQVDAVQRDEIAEALDDAAHLHVGHQALAHA